MFSFSCLCFVFSSVFLICCFLLRALVRGINTDDEESTSSCIHSSDGRDLEALATGNNVENTITCTHKQLHDLIQEQVRKVLQASSVRSSDSEPASSSNKHCDEPESVEKSNMPESQITPKLFQREVAHVSFKPPQPLYTQNPEVWFVILEQQFQIANIVSENTRYSHAVSALDARLHNQFANLITRSKGKQPYTIFKQEVLRVLGESERTKLNRLLHGLKLEEQKPSQLLDQMRMNAGTHFEESTMRRLWLQRLPPQIQLVLVPFENDIPLEKLAERADELVETMTQQQIYSVSNQARGGTKTEYPAPEVNEFQDILSKFRKDILAEVATLQTTMQRTPSPHRNFNAPQRRDRSKSRERQYDENECFYHRRFGSKATKCVTGCKHHGTFNQANTKN